MATVESAWDRYPDYRIDLVAVRGTARVWHGDLLLAESDRAVRLIETDHVERLYLPEADVRLALLEGNDHHTVCPFKGEADYWSLEVPHDPVEDVFWTYRRPFPEVAGIEGYLGVYHEKVRVEIETRWDADPTTSTVPFPAWGDEDDLLRLIEAEPGGPSRFVAPGYHDTTRNVVEGGQLLAQALVAAARTVPDQRLTSAYITFPKAATFDQPVELAVEPLRLGRTFSTLSVRGKQGGTLVSPALVLMGTDIDEDVMRDTVAMPEVAGPEESEPLRHAGDRPGRPRGRRGVLTRSGPDRSAGAQRVAPLPGQPGPAPPAQRPAGPSLHPLDDRRGHAPAPGDG